LNGSPPEGADFLIGGRAHRVPPRLTAWLRPAGCRRNGEPPSTAFRPASLLPNSPTPPKGAPPPAFALRPPWRTAMGAVL